MSPWAGVSPDFGIAILSRHPVSGCPPLPPRVAVIGFDVFHMVSVIHDKLPEYALTCALFELLCEFPPAAAQSPK